MSALLPIFDSHAHYDEPAFDADREEVLAALPPSGVRLVVNPGCSVASSRAAAALAARHPFVFSAAGIHPEEAGGAAEADLNVIGDIARETGAVAIGEIGLDYHWEEVPRETQLLWFERQLGLAKELDLPVIVHDRDAHADTLALLRKYRPRGIVHCYSGSAEMAEELLSMGLYLGFTGVVTFKNARRAVETVTRMPLERLLIETDCPYMAPEPFRGTRCDSRLLPYTLARVAEIRGIEPEAAAQRIFQNTIEAYGLAGDARLEGLSLT